MKRIKFYEFDRKIDSVEIKDKTDLKKALKRWELKGLI